MVALYFVSPAQACKSSFCLLFIHGVSFCLLFFFAVKKLDVDEMQVVKVLARHMKANASAQRKDCDDDCENLLLAVRMKQETDMDWVSNSLQQLKNTQTLPLLLKLFFRGTIEHRYRCRVQEGVIDQGERRQDRPQPCLHHSTD